MFFAPIPIDDAFDVLNKFCSEIVQNLLAAEKLGPRDYARASRTSCPELCKLHPEVWREIYHHLSFASANSFSNHPHPIHRLASLDTASIQVNSPVEKPSQHSFIESNMFRTAILRSSAAAVRSAATAMRPAVPSHAATRLAIGAVAPRVSKVFSPKAGVAFQAVRCYAAGGGLARSDVYERIKSLLTGFDKVRFVFACFAVVLLKEKVRDEERERERERLVLTLVSCYVF